MASNVYPVILSGGTGTRLWPLSRENKAKQFMKIDGDYTMIQAAALRLSNYQNPIVVCNHNSRFTVADQLNQVEVEPSAILLEPEAKNTAPAIALAAHQALETDPDSILVILASDHLIADGLAFKKAVEQAVIAAQEEALIAFGVVPDRAETGFGYIQASHSDGLSQIKQFVEKPDLKTAEAYLQRGDFLWNSGMFVFSAKFYLAELQKFSPEIYNATRLAHQNAKKDLDFIRVDEKAFSSCPSDSIDYAVMEKTSNGMVLPISVGWSDLGSFTTLSETFPKDENGNTCVGDVQVMDTRDSFIHSQDRLVAMIGVHNLTVINTKDALLVANNERAQDVKKMVAMLKHSGRREYLYHSTEYRPWGEFETLDRGERYQVKRIRVKPGASISKQFHHHRAEHWVVVKGTALIYLDGKERMLTENESVYIPIGAVHQLKNIGKMNLELIEVQSGSYLGEDDIVRLEDNYNRVSG